MSQAPGGPGPGAASGGVVVVGAGIAGVATAGALRAGGYAGPVTLIDAGGVPHDRPPLSKDYLAGTRDLAQIALEPAAWYAEHRIDLLTGTEVTALATAGPDDPVAVTLADGRELRADRVVLATGGRPVRPAIPGAGSSRVHVLRDAADADRLRLDLVPGARLLVVGAGLVGAEVASTAHGLGCQVLLVDPLDPPLAGAVGPPLARWLHAEHETHGVATVTATVESLQATRTGIAAQLRGQPGSAEFDAVLLAVGMSPMTALAEAAGLEVDRGVLVDERQVTSHPCVLAVGDASRPRGHRRGEHWEAARLDGERAAATILGADPAPASAPWFWTDRHHRHVEVVGEMRAADAEHRVVVRGEEGVPPFSVWTLRVSPGGDAGASTGTVIGAAAVDDSRAVRAAQRFIDRGVPVDPGALADPATDLRRLLRGL